MPNIDSSLATGLIGALLCLFGFSLYMGGLRVFGLFLGGAAGMLIGLALAYFLFPGGGSTAPVVILVAAVIGMGLGLRAVKSVHGVLVFLIGLGLFFFLGQVVLRPYGGIWAEPWMPFALAIVGGVVSTVLFRYVIIFVTAAVGAYLIYQVSGQGPWVLLLAFSLGLLIQLGLFHRLGLNKRVKVDWS